MIVFLSIGVWIVVLAVVVGLCAMAKQGDRAL